MIKKLINQLMDRLLQKTAVVLIEPPRSVRLQAKQEFEALLELVKESDTDPDLRAIGLMEVSTTHANLVEQLTYMEGINRHIQANRALTYLDLNYEGRVITLSKYLVAKDGKYISLTKIKPFCEEGIKLCDLTEAGETAVSGIAENNLRVLRPFFTGCISVCREFSALYQQ